MNRDSSCSGVKLVGGDVGVAANGREIGMAEVGGDETGIAGLLAQPGRGGVAERVGADGLLDSGSLGCAPDQRGEDRRGEPFAGKAAEDGVLACGSTVPSEPSELVGERWRQRLAPGFAAFAATHEQRGLVALEVEVAPVEREQLRASQPCRDEGEEDELVAGCQPGPSSQRRTRCGQQAGELRAGEPVGSSSRKGSGTPERRLNQRKKRRSWVKRR